MHSLAGLDEPTSGTVAAVTEITAPGDSKLTHLRREHIGFVCQFLQPPPHAQRRGERPAARWTSSLSGRGPQRPRGRLDPADEPFGGSGKPALISDAPAGPGVTPTLPSAPWIDEAPWSRGQ
jgi:hypothetical protein